VNPFHIYEPSVISFSGGRTSGYMLYRIIEEHGGRLPDYVHVVFANTGREMPETLDFVEHCAKAWHVDIVWVELSDYFKAGVYTKGRHKGKPIYKATTKIVNHATASRNGEPFEILLRRRNYLPNVVQRFCTSELKIRRIGQYLETIGTIENQYIGIRADEARRAAKIKGKREQGREMVLPLYDARIIARDIGVFWKAQPFDLQLPNNDGVTDWGNCDLCFLKGYDKKMSIIRARPDLAEWWIKQEREISGRHEVNRRFNKDHPTYSEMLDGVNGQPELLGFDDSFSCYCGG